MNWIKNNWKGLLILGAAIAATAALTIVILLNRVDSGFMTKDNDGKPLPCGAVHWHRASLPIPVMLEHTSEHLRKETAEAMVWWNDKAGIELFKAGGVLTFPKEQPDGTILVEDVSDGSLEDDEGNIHGLTTWRAKDDTGYCRAVSMHVRVPGKGIVEWENTRAKIMRHELGHSLGLDHDDWERSVMYRGTKFELDTLTEDDHKLLKETYGR